MESISGKSEADGPAEGARERKASERGGREVGVWNGSGIGGSRGPAGKLVSCWGRDTFKRILDFQGERRVAAVAAAAATITRHKRKPGDVLLDLHLHLVSGRDLAERRDPEIVELLLVQLPAPLLADHLLQHLLLYRRRVGSVPFLVDQVSAFPLGPTIAQLLHRLVRDDLNAADLLAVGLAGWRERDGAAEAERVGLEDVVVLAADREVLVAESVGRAGLALGLEQRVRPSRRLDAPRPVRYLDALGPLRQLDIARDDRPRGPAHAAVSDGDLLLSVPGRIGAEQGGHQDPERCGQRHALPGRVPSPGRDGSAGSRGLGLRQLELLLGCELFTGVQRRLRGGPGPVQLA